MILYKVSLAVNQLQSMKLELNLKSQFEFLTIKNSTLDIAQRLPKPSHTYYTDEPLPVLRQCSRLWCSGAALDT